VTEYQIFCLVNYLFFAKKYLFKDWTNSASFLTNPKFFFHHTFQSNIFLLYILIKLNFVPFSFKSESILSLEHFSNKTFSILLLYELKYIFMAQSNKILKWTNFNLKSKNIFHNNEFAMGRKATINRALDGSTYPG
jgi:hypothetical protein